MSDPETRRRWINVGEVIALLALIVSALGVWISWKNGDEKPAPAATVHQAIPLTLVAKRADDGTRLTISPAEPSHALQSLTVTLPKASPINVGSDGELEASDVQSALKARDDEPKDRTLSVRAAIDTRYVEAGKDRHASGNYNLRYMWKGGGLFGDRTLHLVSLSR